LPPTTRSQRRAPNPLLRRVEIFCWIGGLAGVGWLLLTVMGMLKYQVSENRQLERLEQRSQAASTRAPTLQPGDPVGKLSIPRIGLSAIVAEGVDEKTLRHAVGHIPETSVPERLGNVGLAGHRDTFFRNLGRLQLNDLIVLETSDGKYEYQVVRTAVVGPQEAELLGPSEPSDLTLVTCFPFRYVGPAPQRFVVQAVRTGDRRF